MDWPETLSVNAWNGRTVAGEVSEKARRWALFQWRGAFRGTFLKPDEQPDKANWRHPKIGWGLILPENDNISPEDKAVAADAPAPIRRLVRERCLVPAHQSAPVLRFKKDSPNAFTNLWRYYQDGKVQPIPIATGPRGVEVGSLPYYLLIYGPPDEVPWQLQYILNNPNAAVGRLHLTGDALERYVDALIGGWPGAKSNVRQAIIWSVDHGVNDITHLMRRVIAERVHAALARDNDIGPDNAVLLSDNRATVAELGAALSQRRPALIVSTSHGMTGPLDDMNVLSRNIGLLVDQDRALFDAKKVLGAWQPDGAIWYSHACCSAGTDSLSVYQDLVKPGSDVYEVISGVSALGAGIAPLPTALLSAEKPLRAFVGHVEPTFDWTLRHPETKVPLAAGIPISLYQNLYQPEPLGYALRDCFVGISPLLTAYNTARKHFSEGGDTSTEALFCQLATRDLQSLVLLGDPTVTLPAL